MLLDPTYKFIDKCSKSKHYLNCPKHMFNYQINCLVRGYSREQAIKNIRWFFEYFDYPLKEVEAVVDYHLNIHVAEFNKLNINSYIDKPPAWTIEKTNHISKWIEAHTPPATYFNPYPEKPSYPFLNKEIW